MAEKNTWLIIVIAAVVVIYGASAGWFSGGANVPDNNQNSNGNIITTNPTIAVAAADAQQSGTAVGNAIQYSVNGGSFLTASSSTAVPGQVLSLLVTNSSGAYHANIVTDILVTPSSFPVSIKMNKNASVTENIYSTTGIVANNGVANQTDGGNGASYNLKDEMTAAALTSTQDMTCVIELTLGTNATTSPSGATLAFNGAALPLKATSAGWYTVAGVNSKIWVYDVPALSSSATQTLTIGLNAKSNGRFSAGSKMIKTCYTKEHFIDAVTGKLAYDIVDSNGNLKNIASYTDTVYFA